MMPFRLLCAASLTFLMACPSSNSTGTKLYTETCMHDAECKSGRCVPGSNGLSFCSQTCTADTQCTNAATLYCCEQLDDQAWCTQPSSSECRPSIYGDACLAPGDPFCARNGYQCTDVGGRNICTFACQSNFDCNMVNGSTCENVNGENLCVTPDLNNLVRLESNCSGDRDCTTAGEICLPLFDNDIDPQLYVTVCSAEKVGDKAPGQTCASGGECDHGFCFRNVCTAPCLNDSHCGAGNVCQPIVLDIPNEIAQQVFQSVLSFCRPQNGSFRPCDSHASSCPTGEFCQWELRYDASISNVCSSNDPLPSGSPPVSDTFAGPGEACSEQDGAGAWQGLVDEGGMQKIKLCGSGFCASELRYCWTPCLADSDCVGAGPDPLVCAYSGFFSHCERVNESQPGTANGGACSGTSQTAANNVCKSGFCDLDTGTCAERRADGASCTASTQCKSNRCIDDKCAKLCRDDATCGDASVCEAQLDVYDQFGTPTFGGDDSVDTPTFCKAFSECPSPPCGDLVYCPENACPADTICRPVMQRGGQLRGVCGVGESGGPVGTMCNADDACSTRMCIGFGTAATTRCSSVCIDDTDCGNGTVCVPATISGLAADRICASPPGTAAIGAECMRSSDCASFMCLDNRCTALCPKGAALGDACGGGTCARVGVVIDARLTEETFDDRLGFVDACVPDAAPWAGDPATCAAPKRFVFRPRNGELVGACQQPLETTLADGNACQASTQCASGLCVDRVCRAPCSTNAHCPAPLACDANARALLEDDNTVTDEVAACRAPCTTDGECGAGNVCEPDIGNGRFCRKACAMDRDCSPGQTCGGTFCSI